MTKRRGAVDGVDYQRDMVLVLVKIIMEKEKCIGMYLFSSTRKLYMATRKSCISLFPYFVKEENRKCLLDTPSKSDFACALRR